MNKNNQLNGLYLSLLTRMLNLHMTGEYICNDCIFNLTQEHTHICMNFEYLQFEVLIKN